MRALCPALLFSAAPALLCKIIDYKENNAENEGEGQQQRHEQKYVQVNRAVRSCVDQSENKRADPVNAGRNIAVNRGNILRGFV